MSLYSEYYLSHYGVKGMKWGVRKKDLKASIRKAQVDKSRADNFKSRGMTEDEYKGPGKKAGYYTKQRLVLSETFIRINQPVKNMIGQ